jgi:PEP-CTERM motif
VNTFAVALAAIGAFAVSANGATLITEADFGGDFAGSVFDTTATNIGIISANTIISGVMDAGAPSDAVFFTSNITITSIMVQLTNGTEIDFGINLGTGSTPEYFALGGTPDIFGSASLAVPGAYELLTSPIPAGTYFLTFDDATQGITYSATLTTVPEPSSAILIGLGALGFVVNRRRAK